MKGTSQIIIYLHYIYASKLIINYFVSVYNYCFLENIYEIKEGRKMWIIINFNNFNKI